jgi:hypothetical protein
MLRPSATPHRPPLSIAITASQPVSAGRLPINNSQVVQIQEILAKLSKEELTRSIARMTHLRNLPLPTVPEYAQLISPAELEQALCKCSERIVILSQHLYAFTEELGDEGHRFNEQAIEAQANAYQVLDLILRNAADAAPVARRINDILVLASRAMPFLGLWTKQFCYSIQTEAERRAAFTTETLVYRALCRHFDSDDAKSVIENHQVTSYLHCRKSLSSQFECVKRRVQELHEAETGIKQRPEEVRDVKLLELSTYQQTALFPVKNVMASYAFLKTVSQLKDTLESATPAYPAYVDLASRAPRYIWQALMNSAMMSLVVCLFFGGTAFFAFGPLARQSPWLIGLTTLFIFTFAISAITYVWNMILARVALKRWYLYACHDLTHTQLPNNRLS